MNILAIGDHFDNLELGCGGSLAKHCRNGDHVVGFVATNSEFSAQNGKTLRNKDIAKSEAIEASNIIGYRLLMGDISTFYVESNECIHVKILELIEQYEPALIYTHWNHDVHHDHRNLSVATLHVARHVPRILMYRSNWYPSDVPFYENFFVDISDTWDLKERAICAYKSEIERTKGKWIDYFRREAENHGLEIGRKYVEAFQVVRWLE